MFIAIDIGNTSTVLGIYENDALTRSWRFKTIRRQSEKELKGQIQDLFKTANITIGGVEGVGISSVVPMLDKIYMKLCRKIFHIDPLIINIKLDLGISLRYDNPESIGADRICNAIAGFARYGGPLIIIDFGTATTYDVVASNGDYLGGVIAPGIETSASGLHRKAAKLPKVLLSLPHKIIGTDTAESMQIGILLGAVDAMTGMVRRIQMEIVRREGKKATVIATGGFSAFIAQNSDMIEHVDAALVLEGIRLIHRRVKSG